MEGRNRDLDAIQFRTAPASSVSSLIGNGGCKRHGTRHADVRQGDNESFSFFWLNDMAHDATFVASI
jgi:hypothetical protein